MYYYDLRSREANRRMGSRVCPRPSASAVSLSLPYLDGLVLVAALVLGVEGEELEDEEVEDAGDEGEAEHDEDQHEGHVLGRLLQRVVLLQRHVVPEPDRRQRREPVVDGVQVAPLCKKTNKQYRNLESSQG